MQIKGTEVDAYGWPAEAAEAHRQMRTQEPTADVSERPRVSGARPAYAVWGTRLGAALQLSRYMPDEATAWINANCQLTPQKQVFDRPFPKSLSCRPDAESMHHA